MELARDLIIIISFGLILIFMIFTGILGFLFYRRIKFLTASIKSTVNSVKQLKDEIKQAVNSSREVISMFRKEPKEAETNRPEEQEIKS